MLADGLTLSPDTIQSTTETLLNIKDLAQYRDPFKLNELLNLLDAVKKLGATIPQIEELAAESPNTDGERIARSLLRAKYGADSWREIVKPISDKLRVWQRDVLVDYLIHREELRDANELYEYYLIDPQMSPGMITSRLVQAIAAVQLFVQRCLLNLEDVTLNDDDRKRWKWMKNYRV